MDQPSSLFNASEPAAHLVVGATGGLGSALVRQLRARGLSVLTTARRSAQADIELDLQDDTSIGAVAQALKQQLGELPLRSVFICSGLLHAEQVRPERRIEALESAAFERVMRVNALGPLLLLAQLKGLLARDQATQVAAVSARVGSISDNRLGGWYSYRCSKAALNMGIKSLAVEMQRTHPRCALTVFHPGTTDTALSMPFQSGVSADKLFSPERAAEQFLEVVRGREQQAGVQFLAWDGQVIEW